MGSLRELEAPNVERVVHLQWAGKIELAHRFFSHGDRERAVEVACQVYREANEARNAHALGSSERWACTVIMARAQTALLGFRHDLQRTG